MGYCHYWIRPRVIIPPVFARIADDFARLTPEWTRLGVSLAGPLGTGCPVVSRQEIAFNGRIRCRHPHGGDTSVFTRLLAVASLLSMAPDQRETASRQLWEEEHSQRRCPGNCAFETFWFPRVAPRGAVDTDGSGRFCDRTKTAFRPYDIAVTSALLIARHHLGDDMRLDSDGGQVQWWEARLLCQSVLGYGFKVRLGLHDE